MRLNEIIPLLLVVLPTLTSAKIEALRDSCKGLNPGFAVYDSELDMTFCYSFMYISPSHQYSNFESYIDNCKKEGSELLTVNSDEEVLFITDFLNPLLKMWRLTLRFQYDSNARKILPYPLKDGNYADKLAASLNTEECSDSLCCIFLSRNDGPEKHYRLEAGKCVRNDISLNVCKKILSPSQEILIILLFATLLNVAVIVWSVMRYKSRVKQAEIEKEKRAKKEAAKKKAALARKNANRSPGERPITRKYERMKSDDVIYDTVAGWIITESSLPAESDSQSANSFDASKKFLYESILEDVKKKKTEKKRRKHEKIMSDHAYDSAPETSFDKGEKTEIKASGVSVSRSSEKRNSDSVLPIDETLTVASEDTPSALDDDTNEKISAITPPAAPPPPPLAPPQSLSESSPPPPPLPQQLEVPSGNDNDQDDLLLSPKVLSTDPTSTLDEEMPSSEQESSIA